MIDLYQGNCLLMMHDIPDVSVDLVLCDLPYGTTQNKWDSVIPFGPLWDQYKRVCKGAIVLTAAQPFTSALVMSNPREFKQELIWKKNTASNFLNANRAHLARHESVLLFGKGVYNPQMTPGKAYVRTKRNRGDTGENYGNIRNRTDTFNNGDRKPISVLDFDREPKPVHPTQKPVALMEYLIKTYTNPGDTVLDNCMGSGTTGVACVNTGRKFIGIEQDHKYFQIAMGRINDTSRDSHSDQPRTQSLPGSGR